MSGVARSLCAACGMAVGCAWEMIFGFRLTGEQRYVIKSLFLCLPPTDTTSSGYQREGDQAAGLLLDGKCWLCFLICDRVGYSRLSRGFELSAHLASLSYLLYVYVGSQSVFGIIF